MDKTTKGFVIAACTVVIVAGASAGLKEINKWMYQARLRAERQERLESCNKVARHPNRGAYNFSGNAEWQRCLNEFGRRWQ